MPLVNVRLIEGVFTPEQKREMIHQLTETMVEIEGENLRPVTWVIVEEVKSGDWGIGGNGLVDRGCPCSAGPGPGHGPGLRSADGDTAGTAARAVLASRTMGSRARRRAA